MADSKNPGFNLTPQATSGRTYIDPHIHDELTANPSGEGVYRMVAPDGRSLMVPFSKVASARWQNKFTIAPSEWQRYDKDYTHAPNPGVDWNPKAGLVHNIVQRDPILSTITDPDFWRQAGSDTVGIGKGVGQLFSAPKTIGDKAALLLGPAGLPAKRLVEGAIQGERAAAHQVKRYTDDANALTWKDAAPKLLSYGRAGVTGLSMANPLDVAGVASSNDLSDAGQDHRATASGLVHIASLFGGDLLPAAGQGVATVLKPVTKIGGEALRDSGITQMDRFLNGGKDLPLSKNIVPMHNEAGRAVLEAGPKTSVAASPRSMMKKINKATQAADAEAERIAAGSGAQVQTRPSFDAVDQLSDSGVQYSGNDRGETPLRNYVEGMWDSLAGRDSMPVSEALQVKRIADDAVGDSRWTPERPSAAGKATRNIQSQLNEALIKAEPAIEGTLRSGDGLRDANTRLETNQNVLQGPDPNPAGIAKALTAKAAATTAGAGVGVAFHLNLHGATLGAGLGYLSATPLFRTALATGAYHLGNNLIDLVPRITDTGATLQPFLPAAARVAPLAARYATSTEGSRGGDNGNAPKDAAQAVLPAAQATSPTNSNIPQPSTNMLRSLMSWSALPN